MKKICLAVINDIPSFLSGEVLNFKSPKDWLCDAFASCEGDSLGAVYCLCEIEDKIKEYDVLFIVSSKYPLIDSFTINDSISAHLSGKFAATAISSSEYEDIAAAVIDISALGEVKNIKSVSDALLRVGENGHKIGIHLVNSDSIFPITSASALSYANDAAQEAIIQSLLENDVVIISKQTTFVSPDAEIESEAIILPNTIIKGKSVIKKGAVIGPNSVISDSTIGEGSVINACQILESTVGNNTKIGPFTQLRPNSHIGDNVKIGDFVEVKNSTIGDSTSVAHLTYVGDSDVGRKVNFGCGTVTVNYDGKNKFRTQIGDYAFIGCNSNLIAPVKIGDNAFTAAGSTVTHDVPDDALYISREKDERIIEGWAEKKLGKRRF